MAPKRKTKSKTSAVKRRARRTRKRGRGPAVLDAPPAPPAPPANGEAPAGVKYAPPPELLAIADRLAKSTDPLEGNALAHAALLASMKDVLTDDSLSPAQRRKELRTIAAAAKDLLPDSRRWEVDQAIKRDAAALAERARARGAKLEAAPPVPASARVIPLRPELDFGAAPPAKASE